MLTLVVKGQKPLQQCQHESSNYLRKYLFLQLNHQSKEEEIVLGTTFGLTKVFNLTTNK